MRCTSSDRVLDLDNWTISLSCHSLIEIPSYQRNQTRDAFSTAQNFSMPAFVDSECNREISYRIRTKDRATEVPEGLQEEVIEENGMIYIVSETTEEVDLEFYLEVMLG